MKEKIEHPVKMIKLNNIVYLHIMLVIARVGNDKMFFSISSIYFSA